MLLTIITLISIGLIWFLYELFRKKPLIEGVSHRFNGKHVKPSYDYIVIGSGSAGSIVAAKLVKAGKQVLLLEAGGEYHQMDFLRIDIWRWLSNLFSPSLWDFVTTAQKSAANRHIWANRGKTTGGSSAVNGCMWVRGAPEDFDRWAEESGDSGWSYKSLMKHWIAMEDYDEGEDKFHGRNGPIIVRRLAKNAEDPNRMVGSFVKNGFKEGDYNGETNNNMVSITQENCGSGIRSDCFTAYIEPLLGDKNLTVVSSAMVHRVTIENKRATGVEVMINGSLIKIKANKEVIVSCGTFQSPQLLMLSGIGPADHLTEKKIEVKLDNPNVGQNLFDHPATGVAVKLKRPWNEDSYEGSGASVLAFYQSKWAKKNDPNRGADLQFLPGSGPTFRAWASLGAVHTIFSQNCRPYDTVLGRLYRNLTRIFSPIMIQLMKSQLDKMLNLGIVCNRPESRGSIRLRSNNPLHPPEIDPHYLEKQEDVDRLVEAIRRAREVIQAGPIAELIDSEFAPGSKVKTDEEIANYIRTNGFLLFHPVGTCKMSKNADAVVDSRLRVVGVSNLRVIDASIIPFPVSGNSQMAACAVGSRGADLILEDAK